MVTVTNEPITIDIDTEELIYLPDAPAHFPGRRPSHQAIFRWYKVGVRGGIKLPTCVIGNRRYTSVEGIRAFIQAQNQAGSVTFIESERNDSPKAKSALTRKQAERLGIA